MIEKFEIKGVHSRIDDNLRKYVTKKIGRLDKYLPRAHRDSVHTVVELKEAKSSDKNKYTCDVTMHLPHETINIRENTMNMYAAVDIVETKLKLQIKKYRETHSNGRLTRHLTARFRRRAPSVVPEL